VQQEKDETGRIRHRHMPAHSVEDILEIHNTLMDKHITKRDG